MSHSLAYQTQDQTGLAKAMRAQYARDIDTIRQRGIWPPPWMNEDFTIQQDEARLLTAIADHQDIYWHSSRPDICRRLANLMGMASIGNTKTTISRCMALGYIKGPIDNGMIRLDLTHLGRAMLDMWEERQNSNSDNAGFEYV